MKIHGAIFDMDGLMFDTERLFFRAFREAVEPQTGLRFPPEQLMKLVGRNAQSGRRLFGEMFPEADYDRCFSIKRDWVTDYIEKNGLPVKPGLFPLLDHLKALGCPIAVASSTHTDTVEHYMRLSGVYPYLSSIIGGDMVKEGKPHPEIFLTAAGALGQRPEDCMVFEDSKNGLLAASRGSFPCIIVPDLADPTERLPGLCFARLHDLAEAIPLIEG